MRHSISVQSGFVKYLLALLGFIIFAAVAYNVIPSYPYGDGTEYILMTESFVNHGSPELRELDVVQYMDDVQEGHGFVHKKEVYDSVVELTQTENDFNTGWYGFFAAKNGNLYCFHFWFYSLVNVPSRLVLEWIGGDITQTFLLTNLLLMFGTLLLIWKSTRLKTTEKFFASTLFVFSPVYWYIAWPHPEVYTASAVFSAIILYFDRKYFWSLFLFSVAAMHNPPLFMPALLVFGTILYNRSKEGGSIFDIRLLSKLFLASFWIVVPSLFYLYHYNVPNLIVEQGFISTDNLNLKRLSSFLFDLNQGMIIGIPLVLLLSFFLFARRIAQRKIDAYLLFYLTAFLMGVFYLQMGNWNHGMVVVNRYSVWVGAIITIFVVLELRKWKPAVKNSTLTFVLITQVVVCSSFINYKNIWWGYGGQHYPVAKWVMNNHPEWYNPDPGIFRARTSRAMLSTTDTVVVYAREDSTIMKLLVWEEGGISQLKARGIDSEKVDDFAEKLDYYNGWAYVNKIDLDELGYVQEADTFITFAEKLNEVSLENQIRDSMLSNPEWLEALKEKAAERNISLEEVMQNDIDWIIQQERK